jgi:nucleoside-diphosphate-sugar epimerase
MKVLVTGAAGFIGSHLTRALLDAGHEVRAIDNLSTGQFWRIESLVRSGAVEWLEADLRNAAAAARAVAGVEGVLHQAAIPSVSRSLVDPVASNDANVGGTVTLLQACREARVRRLVYAASSSAYGNTPTLPKVETMCPSPLSPYAVSKLAGEQYCQVFARLGHVETVCLRYFNIFGPMQDPSSQYAAVIPKFACALLGGQPITLQGDGTQSRDFTYVANAVQANLRALEATGVSGEMFNVGCGQRYDLNELIRQLAEITGGSPRIERQPGRPGDVPHSLADISKAGRLLGYEPGVDFRKGLEFTVSWLMEEGARRYPAVKAPVVSR